MRRAADELKSIRQKAVAAYKGLIIDRYAELLLKAQVITIAVKFGTHPRPQLQRASLAG